MICKLTVLLILCASLCFADEEQASSETKKVKKPVTQLQIGVCYL